MYDLICKIFLQAGMTMTKWISNSEQVTSALPEDKRAPIQTESIQFASNNNAENLIPEMTKVVGMTWIPSKDVFTFQPYSNLTTGININYTKRFVSSMVPRIYDVNGYVAPFTLRGN